jgi:protein TonB
MLLPAIMNYDHARRVLFAAFFLSLLLHLLLIFGWGWQRPVPPTMAQSAMQVVVSARPVAVSQPAAAMQSPASPKSTIPSLPPAPVKTQPKPLAPAVLAVGKPAPQPAPQQEAAPAVSSSVPAVAVASAPVRESASAAVAARDSGKNPASDVAEGVSADGLRQYRIELASAARRFRAYPALARARGWEGVAQIVVSVSAEGGLPAVKLARTSGHGVLDEQAVEMLSHAAAATPVPASLLGRSFVVPMPIRFSLED